MSADALKGDTSSCNLSFMTAFTDCLGEGTLNDDRFLKGNGTFMQMEWLPGQYATKQCERIIISPAILLCHTVVSS